jgi:hypothetical protein
VRARDTLEARVGATHCDGVCGMYAIAAPLLLSLSIPRAESAEELVDRVAVAFRSVAAGVREVDADVSVWIGLDGSGWFR